MIFLDTHILIYLAAGTGRIRFADEYATRPLGISPISAAEIGCLQRAGRIELGMSADTWFDLAIRRFGAQVLPLGPGILARAMTMAWDHQDPADRILVQTLRETPGAELHTRDARILAYGREHGLSVRDCRL